MHLSVVAAGFGGTWRRKFRLSFEGSSMPGCSVRLRVELNLGFWEKREKRAPRFV